MKEVKRQEPLCFYYGETVAVDMDIATDKELAELSQEDRDNVVFYDGNAGIVTGFSRTVDERLLYVVSFDEDERGYLPACALVSLDEIECECCCDECICDECMCDDCCPSCGCKL